MAPPHLKGTLSCRPGVLRQGLLFLLTVRLKQEVVTRVDDYSHRVGKSMCERASLHTRTPKSSGVPVSGFELGGSKSIKYATPPQYLPPSCLNATLPMQVSAGWRRQSMHRTESHARVRGPDTTRQDEEKLLGRRVNSRSAEGSRQGTCGVVQPGAPPLCPWRGGTPWAVRPCGGVKQA